MTLNISPENAGGLQFSQPLKLSALEQRLNIAIVFSVCLVAFYLIAWNRGIALLHGLWAIMIVSLAASLLGPWLMLRPARLRLQLPAQAAVGDEIRIVLQADYLAWPPQRMLITLNGLFPFSSRPALLLPKMRGHEEFQARVSCDRRGVFAVADALASTAYPLGILPLRRVWPVQGGTIQIAPRVWPLRQFSPQRGRASLGDENARATSRPGQDVFRDMRDYRAGDNPRHIHWRSSARHDRLIVRQYDSIATAETVLVLNSNPELHVGTGNRNSFEMAIEIAASVANALLRDGLRCGLAAGLRADGGHDCWLEPATGEAQWRRILQALTLLQTGRAVPYAVMLQSLQSRYRQGQCWILFDHEVRPPALPGFLAASDVAPYYFRFDAAGFASAADSAVPELRTAPTRSQNGCLIGATTDLSRVLC